MEESVVEGPSYEDKLKFVSVIAKPMANKKLTKKIYKLIKRQQTQDLREEWVERRTEQNQERGKGSCCVRRRCHPH